MKYVQQLLLTYLFGHIIKNRFRDALIDPRVLVKLKRASNDKISVIVYHKECPVAQMKKCLSKDFAARVKYYLPIINAFAVEVPANRLNRLAFLNEVDYIDEDSRVFIHMDTARETIKSFESDDIRYTGKGVGVAVIDTGVAPHPDLVEPTNRIIAFKDFINRKSTPYDDNGHGTHVAGCIAGNGYSSKGKYSGIAPEASIIAVKALDKDGGGDISDVIAAIQWVVDNRHKYNIKVLNMSLGTQPGRSYSALDRAVMAAWKEGITVIAAAGNNGPKRFTISSPGICPDVITVGALDDRNTSSSEDDTVAGFSSRGPTLKRISKPDLVAPGVDIISLAVPEKEGNTDMYASLSGTSMATPIVSGCAALIHQKAPSISNIEAKNLLMSTTDKLRYPSYVQGKGLINMQRIFAQLEGGEHHKQ